MNLWQGLSALLLLAASVPPAHATDNHEYGKDEYAIIRDGLAPNRKLSLATHGDGQFGYENFHVWLMAEPARRRIMALGDVGENNVLDAGPGAYHASWSGDSRRVAINFRSNRRIVELNVYRIENHGARRVKGPTLFREVAGRDVNDRDDLRRSIPTMVWRGADRFTLTEQRLFITQDTGFAGRLGGYAKVTDKLGDGRVAVEFSAEADCAISGGRYRILDIRVGKFDDAKRESPN